MTARLDSLRTLQRDLAPFVGPGFRRWLAVVAGIGLVIGLLEAAALRIIGELAGGIGEPSGGLELLGARRSVGTLCLLGFVAVAVVIAARWFEARIATRLAMEPMERVREDLVEAWLLADHGEQRRHRAGRIQELLTGHAPAVGNIVLGIAVAISAACVVLVLTVIAVVIEPLAVAFFVGAIIVLALVVSPLQRRIRRHAEAQADAQLGYGTVVNDTVTSSDVVRFFATTDAAEARHRDASSRAAAAGLDIMALRRFSSNFYRSLTMLVLIAGLGLLLWRGGTSLAAAGAVTLLVIRALLETQAVYVNLVLVTEKLPFLEDLRGVFDEFRGSAQVRGAETIGPIDEVRVDAVTHRYEADAPATADALSLHVARGERIGISGPSGGGKSSLLLLLLGVLGPETGRVTLNGIDASAIDPVERARQVAVVPQDSFLLTGTVSENVRFDRPWVSDADINAALRTVGLASEIESWPQGLATVIGHRGGRALSGGQRQRISVARAIAGRPSLLLMDEPTSALDARAEAELVASVVEDRGDTAIPTVIVVSHRPEVLTSCDRVLELAGGRLRTIETQP